MCFLHPWHITMVVFFFKYFCFYVLYDTLSARKEKCWLIKSCKFLPFSILARNNSSGEVIFFLGFSGFFVLSVIILYFCWRAVRLSELLVFLLLQKYIYWCSSKCNDMTLQCFMWFNFLQQQIFAGAKICTINAKCIELFSICIYFFLFVIRYI